ncbi:MAG: alanyl-tRNA editing protein [Sphaerochaetaceae bacterium]|nr:alanyl-tRNA editing protein [Sphaerochaetaceae bacterium]
MIETEKLYLKKGYEKEIAVTIADIVPYKKQYGIILDQTIFYPEGGGPPGDRGTIGDVKILDTRYNENKEILHIVSDAGSLTRGESYILSLDWDHRYHYMREHTCQHLISGILYNSFSIDTVSVHLGEEVLSIETGEDEIPLSVIYEIEDEVNRAILSGSLISTKVVCESEAARMELRRPAKVSGDIRIVTIEGYDDIACGGIHLDSVAEIETVLFHSKEYIRNHVRLFFAVADDARKIIRSRGRIIEDLKTQLSTPEQKITSRIDEMKSQIADLKRTVHESEQYAIEYMLQSAMKERGYEGVPVVTLDLSSFSDDALSSAANLVFTFDNIAMAAVKVKENGRANYLIALKGIGDESAVFASLKEQLLDLFGAKGGGKAPVFRGSLSLTGESLQNFFDQFEAVITKRVL